ncbi:MAG: iron chaperone [Actinomycetota bacterium]
MAEKKTPAKKADSTSFSKEERAAMRERARELKAAAAGQAALDEMLAKIKAMSPADRELAEGVHAIIQKIAPELEPRTWYGMPAWAKNGKVICFFQAAGMFKVRYATFGFQHDAKLDNGAMWATSFALIKLNPASKKQIAEMVKTAIREGK